ncbi:MAG: hypothetical protein GXO28_02475 [Methanopyri archaeon]|nr:hypothetical protein [Methanopyri archaeon]
MNVREELLKDIEETLAECGHRVVRVRGRSCFDLLVRSRRDGKTYVVKVLTNADSLQREPAEDLHRVAHFLEAIPVVVSLRKYGGPLRRNVVYHRYGIPVVEPITFVMMVEGELPKAVADRGGYYVKVGEGTDLEHLSAPRRRELRERGGRVSLKRLEATGSEPEFEPVEIGPPRDVDPGKDRMGAFERRVAELLERLGAEETGKVERAPFDLMARDGDRVIARTSPGESDALRGVATLAGCLGFVVTEGKGRGDPLVPSVDIDTLRKLKDLEDLKEYLEEHDPATLVRRVVREESVTSPEEIARKTGLSEEDVKKVLKYVMAWGNL